MEILFCTNRWFCSPRSLSLFYKFRSLRSLSVGMATVAAAPLGHEVPLRQFSAVLGLLGGHSCEERVAGLLITSKTFDRLKGSMSAAQEELLLRDVVDAVSVRFIIRMLTTHTDATDGQMKAAAMNILRVATGYRSIASKFIVYASTLVNELALRDVLFTPEAIEILLSLSNLDTSIANQARNAALKRISSSQNISSPRGVRIILRFIVDLPHSPPEGLVLPRDVAVGLRSMWPQWLHGAADLDTRESAYDLLQYIFRVADPSWTVGSCTNKGNTGEFASFLATIVCGDIRIFFEEHLSFYYAACQGTDRLSTYLPERHQSRIASCFSIIDSMLYFLIGDVGADDGTEPLWGGLPSSALLAIQKAVHAVTNDLMDFIKEAYSMVVGNITFSQSDWGKTCLKNHLTFVIARAQMSITKWALEDPDIMRLLADNISQTIFFSDASKALPPCADDFSCFKICNGLQIEDKFLNLDVLQSMLPLLLELASESPLLSRAREGGGDVMWDDDSMNMLNSAELMCRLVVFLTEVTLWLSGSQIVPCNYDEILATGIMCAELVSMLADMCSAASYYSFDSMAISKIGTEWALLMSSIKLLNGHSKPLLEPEGVEQSDATKSKYANLRKILRQLTRIDIKF